MVLVLPVEIGFLQGPRHREVSLVVRFSGQSKGPLPGAQALMHDFSQKGDRALSGSAGISRQLVRFGFWLFFLWFFVLFCSLMSESSFVTEKLPAAGCP